MASPSVRTSADSRSATASNQSWLASLLEATSAAMIAVDRAGQTIVWNRGAEALFGWSARQVLGRNPPIIPVALIEEWQLQMRQVLDSGKPTPAAETQRLARDGQLVTVIRTSVPLRDPDGQIMGLLDTLTDISNLKQLDEEARALAQVRERELIAMDLHDGMIQSLYALMLLLDARKRALPATESEGRSVLKAALTDVQRVIEETRTYLFDLVARELSPPPRDLGAGFQLLADSLRLNAGINADVQLDPFVEHLVDAPVRAHLLYFAREAVSNVVRHAQATSVQLELKRADDHLLLVVADNGRGLTRATQKKPGRHGLRNMSERARLIGGHLDVTSRKGKGTRVSLQIPIDGTPTSASS